MNGASALCPCGTHHPAGVLCDPALRSGESKHDERYEETCGCSRDHGQSRESAPDCLKEETHCSDYGPSREHGGCCGQGHAAAVPFDPSSVDQASDTRAVYRIENMDCPVEESLIRKKLGTISGISSLDFNLMRRVLTVSHELPSTQGIEEALKSIGMTPEPMGLKQGGTALFSINGMDCPVEENLIRTRLSGAPGVLGLEFNLMRRTLKVRHEPSALLAITEALASLNLDARLMEREDARDSAPSLPKIPWKKLALAGLFAALSEAFELVNEWGARPFGLDMGSWQVNGVEIAEWLPLTFALIAILLGGLTTYKKGWIAVRNLNLNINALMSVAVTGAAIIGQYPEAAMVMVLFNLSEAIEARALDRARNAIKSLLSLTPEKATVLRPDGTCVETDISGVAVGSLVRVRPGERVSLDGIIVRGRSAIDQAPITGESMPVEKTVGDTVYAGTINKSRSFEFEVTAAATDSTLARIIHAVEEAQGSRAPMQRLVDRFAAYYTPAVFFAAVLTALVPPLFLGGAWAESVYTALVLLVIGCPCALVISTPVSIVSGMAAATRHGILVKGGMFLEQGRLLKCVALDKTGTITHGRPRQTDFAKIGDISEDRAIILAHSLAACSDHPVSKAIAEDAAEKGAAPLRVEDFTAVPGLGVSGIIDGEKWYMGNLRLMEELKKSSAWLEKRISALEEQGKSVVALVGERGVQALFAVADTLKDSSIEAIRELKRLGVKSVMLTGDNEHTARAIAAQVGVDAFHGNLLPEDKLKLVEELELRGRTGMVGDGINDAPALAKASIGFAMAGGGTDTAMETADVALMDDDLRKVPRFIRLSRSTYAILMQNICLALGVKALFFGLTFAGQATMWMAVFADVGATLLVVANGLRAMRK